MPEDEIMNKLRSECTQAGRRFLALYQKQLPVEPTLWRYLAPAPSTAKAMRPSLTIIKWRPVAMVTWMEELPVMFMYREATTPHSQDVAALGASLERPSIHTPILVLV